MSARPRPLTVAGTAIGVALTLSGRTWKATSGDGGGTVTASNSQCEVSRAELVAELKAGDYEIACKPGMQGNGIRQKVMVAGALPITAGVLPAAASDALVPGLVQTRTVGLVTLPGAFVGMLLGGADALTAGAVQLFVLVALMAVQALAVAATLELVARCRLTAPRRGTPPAMDFLAHATRRRIVQRPRVMTARRLRAPLASTPGGR